MKYTNICGKDFKTKAKAYKYFRDLVRNTANNFLLSRNFPEPIEVGNSKTFYLQLTEQTLLKNSDVRNLFENYLVDGDWYGRKTKGQDIKNFVLIKDDYDNYCLGFKLEDDSVESVTAKSYLSCFGKGTQTDDERLHSAMRYEVKYQSEEYKKNNEHIQECFDCPCPREAGLDVDHVIPYKTIVNSFFTIYDREEFKKSMNKEIQGLYWRLREDHRKIWQEYHKQHAKFQLLCKECHRLKTAGER